MNATRAYDAYRKMLARSKQFIKCPSCYQELIPKHYENHIRDKHGFNNLTHCIFCKDYLWPDGNKTERGLHLHKCLKQFIKRHAVPKRIITNPTPQIVIKPPIDDSPCNDCEDFYNDENSRRLRQPDWSEVDKFALGSFYRCILDDIPDWLQIPTAKEINDQLRQKQIPTIHGKSFDELEISDRVFLRNELQFDELSGLKDVHEWIRRFQMKLDNVHFYHIGVWAGSFQSFENEMNKIREHVVLLPYWCLCDGSCKANKDNLYTYHRHVILATDDRAIFQRAWKKITVKKYFQKKIKDTLHFFNTIQYLSTFKSNGKSGKNSVFGCTHKNHHWINNPVIPHAVYWMALLVKDIFQNVIWNKAGHKQVEPDKLCKINGRWHGRTEDLLAINCVPRFNPLSLRINKMGCLTASDENIEWYLNHEGSSYIHWINNLFYPLGNDERPVTHLSTLDNVLFHMETDGNTLMNLNRVDWFCLTQKQQEMANQLHRYGYRVVNKKQMEINELQTQIKDLTTENQTLKLEIDQLKNRNE